MAMVTVSKADFGVPEFLVAIRKPVEAIHEITSKAKLPMAEMRKGLLKAFYHIFALTETGKGKAGKQLYGLSAKQIGDRTGYSQAMVNNYKALYENQGKVVTIGQTTVEITENEKGEIVRKDAEPVKAKVSDVAGESDIAELARIVRQATKPATGKGRPALTPASKGDRQARTVIAWTPTQRKAWLTGFCKTFVVTGQQQELESALRHVIQHANRKVRVTQEAEQQATA